MLFVAGPCVGGGSAVPKLDVALWSGGEPSDGTVVVILEVTFEIEDNFSSWAYWRGGLLVVVRLV